MTALADSIEFLSTPEGAAFLEQIDYFNSRALIEAAREKGFHLEAGDVVNGAIELLVAPPKDGGEKGHIARYVAAADGEPWAYLAICLRGWARKQWGHRGWVDSEYLDMIPSSPRNDDELLPMDEAIESIFRLLAPFTPDELHAELHELLSWLWVNPPQRLSYETDDKIAAHRHCPAFTIEQVEAVVNVCWGGRSHRQSSSLFGALIMSRREADPDGDVRDWTLSDSGTHTRALLMFKNRMRAGRSGSRSLTDWGTR